MDKLEKATKRILIGAIVLSVLFPVSISFTVLGAMSQNWVLLGIGTFLLVASFYGTPLIWVKYVNCLMQRHLLDAVLTMNLLTVEELSAHLGKHKGETRKLIQSTLCSGYLKGYKFVNNSYLQSEQTENDSKTIQGLL